MKLNDASGRNLEANQTRKQEHQQFKREKKSLAVGKAHGAVF